MKKKTIIMLCLLALVLVQSVGCGKADHTYKESMFIENISSPAVYYSDFYADTFSDTVAVPMKNAFTFTTKGKETLLIDNTSSQVLFQENSDVKCPPASTTKLMTAYLVLKYGNLNDIVTVKEDIVFNVSGAVALGLKKGDKIKVKDLLHALLLQSANDCAVVLARYISGDEEKFAKLMNETANSFGATHSHFMNPHGLDEENHYSCAYDLYLILKQDLQIPEFVNIVGKDKYTFTYQTEEEKEVKKETSDDSKDSKKKKEETEETTTETVDEEREVTVESTNFYLRGRKETPDRFKIVGGKTGTTDDAGHCLVLCTNNENGHQYVSIILNAKDSDELYDSMSSLLNHVDQVK